MIRILFALAFVTCTFPALLGQETKSGPQRDETLPGAFQPLNVNGPFAGRHHSLVTEFRLNPVILVFVRAQGDDVDPEDRKLLETIDKVAEDRHADTGLESFVVFLTPRARSGATDDNKGIKDKAAYAKSLVEETIHREKLVNNLKEVSKSFKRLIVTCYPAENVAQQYRLTDRAEVTVLVYARQRVFSNFAFAEGQLNQGGIDNVLKAVDAMLDRLKKAPALVK